MKIEFLGHGIFEEQDNTVGNYLHKSFKDKNFDTFKCFVAYTTLSGLSIFMDELEKVKNKYKKHKSYQICAFYILSLIIHMYISCG